VNSLTFYSHYKDTPSLRHAFNDLSQEIFGLDFEPFYTSGWWDDSFVCYTFFDRGKAVSNVSVAKMRFLIRGRELDALQLGTVMTHPDYRERGLARELMANITKEYEGQFSFWFLFANDSVTAFYPRFGFVESPQHVFSCPFDFSSSSKRTLRSLELNKEEDCRLLDKIVFSRKPLSESLSLISGYAITLFHALYAFGDCLLCDDIEKGLLICRQMGEDLHLYDLICPRKFSVGEYLSLLSFPGVKKIVFHFTPPTEEFPGGRWHRTRDRDDLFFIKSSQNPLPAKFCFPVTGRT